jgi:hypothetical protein
MSGEKDYWQWPPLTRTWLGASSIEYPLILAGYNSEALLAAGWKFRVH